MGLYLLSTVSARDFGWAGIADTVDAARGDARHHAAARALSRPLLQLVRHPRPAAARPALRLVGRQRQSRRPSRSPSPTRAASGAAGRRAPDRSAVPGSATNCASCARRCRRCRTTGARRPSPAVRWTMRSTAWARRCARWPPARRARWTRLPRRRPTWSTSRARSPSERGDAAGAEMRFWAEAIERTVASHRRDLAADAAAVRRARRPARRGRGERARHGAWRWNSASCSIRRGSCCRSAFAWPTARSIRAATTCSPRRRGSRASSPSPRATSPTRHWFRLGPHRRRRSGAARR